eukprot:scaffold6279_cov418-Prasinococcus_capsulatus_cf.AAC.12
MACSCSVNGCAERRRNSAAAGSEAGAAESHQGTRASPPRTMPSFLAQKDTNGSTQLRAPG